MFPFTIPWDDTADTITNMSFLNSPIKDENGFVGISEDGHFSYRGQRIRFFGASLSYGANFPQDNDTAKKVARRLAKLGCNLVRLHHMDANYEPQGIWHDVGNQSKRTIDTPQLDRLDYFLSQLKLYGIFVDLNLHVSRTLTEADDIIDDDHMTPNNKGVDLFDPIMRDRHKEYATQLLTHVNPYTQLPYFNDPVIAMVEVTNEDSLLQMWATTQAGLPGPPEERPGWIDNLQTTSHYQDLLDDLWEQWWWEHYQQEPPDDRPSRNDVRDRVCSEGVAEVYIDFLISLEENYHRDMIQHLRTIGGTSSGVKVPISGTNYGPHDTIMSSPFHDRHASFASWNADNQFFLDSITKYPFLYYNYKSHRPIPILSGDRIRGKPYIATELSSQFPNPYAAEPILLVSLYAAFQGWDGILPYAYKHYQEWDINYIAPPPHGSNCDFNRHMTKLVAVTVASLLFRRNDISVGIEDPLLVVTTRKDVMQAPYGSTILSRVFLFITNAVGNSTNPFGPDAGYLPAYVTLMRRIEVDKGEQHSSPQIPPPPQDNIYRTDTNELEWHYDPSTPESLANSFFKADTEKVQVLAGAVDRIASHPFIRGVLSGGSISVSPHPPSTSALIAVILVKSDPNSCTYLIIATGKMENDSQEIDPVLPTPPFPDPPLFQWHAENIWGHGPVWVEGINAQITMAFPENQVQWWALSPTGFPGDAQLPVENLGAESSRLHLLESYETLWYKLEIIL
jgi:hypothetical protein